MTLRSMTGFGRGSAANKHASVEVEIRSVNGKGLSLKMRLPNDRMELEPKLDAIVRKQIERGSVQSQVKIRRLTHAAAALDHEVLKRYLAEWRALEKELGLTERDPDLSQLLALPGAYETAQEKPAATRAVAAATTTAFEAAVSNLISAREKEGKRLAKELLRLTLRLERLRKSIEKHLPKAGKAAAARLEERVTVALNSAGKDRGDLDLSRELVALAERADVQEEIARLEIHTERLRNTIQAGGPCGREIEFMIQECHREVTTLCNKSADAKQTEFCGAMKMIVQQLKEQAANVE